MSLVPKDLAAALRKRQEKKVARTNGNAVKSIAKSVTDLEFVEALFKNGGSSIRTAAALGMSQQSVSFRRGEIELELGVTLPRGRPETWRAVDYSRVLNLSLDNGTILVGSDLHCWPDVVSTSMMAFVDFNKRLKPDVVILNGDGLDGAGISRHGRIGWQQTPTVKEELESLSDYLDEVRKANPNALYKRTRGNHDARFDTFLSAHVPHFEGINGVSLEDHLPGWEECTAVWVNGKECFIKHRGRSGGVHSTFNEVRRLGTNFVHGHLHAQNIVQYRNALGDLYGVDLGMMAAVEGPQFAYCEADVTNWRSGFAVLTFRHGKLMPPVLATVVNEAAGEVSFAGQLLKYEPEE